jgi:hypothetical protein
MINQYMHLKDRADPKSNFNRLRPAVKMVEVAIEAIKILRTTYQTDNQLLMTQDQTVRIFSNILWAAINCGVLVLIKTG